jgi:hypothetical protein
MEFVLGSEKVIFQSLLTKKEQNYLSKSRLNFKDTDMSKAFREHC